MWKARFLYVVLTVIATLVIVRTDLPTWACLLAMLVIGAVSVGQRMRRIGVAQQPTVDLTSKNGRQARTGGKPLL
ncbi:MAG TPA: hypothetical protein V6C81_10870 [Planktothrix sp.]|jgi:hypothetical protein